MPTQPPLSPFHFKGPFLGLNTTAPERGLSPAYAAQADNILLDNGQIQVRPPFVTLYDNRPDHEQLVPQVASMFEWIPASSVAVNDDERPRFILRQYPLTGESNVDKSQLRVQTRDGDIELARSRGDGPFQYVPINDRVYLFNGRDAGRSPLVIDNGLSVRRAGLLGLAQFPHTSEPVTGAGISWDQVFLTPNFFPSNGYLDADGNPVAPPGLEVHPYLVPNPGDGRKWRGAEYGFAVSLYNKDTNVESNGWISTTTLSMDPYVNGDTGSIIGLSASNTRLLVRLVVPTTAAYWPNQQEYPFTHFRIYMARLDVFEAFHLAGEYERDGFPISGVGNPILHGVPQYSFDFRRKVWRQGYWPGATEVDRQPAGSEFVGGTLGNTVTGPFIPVKNAVPYHVRLGAWYKDRLFYVQDGVADRLFYSAFGQPESADVGDFLLLNDDGGEITGLAENHGQLVILKEKSIWILSGTIAGTTNATIALGASAPASSHELYRTKSHVGCSNTGGSNGAIVAGNPSRVHFNSHSGFYDFDGTNTRLLTGRIDPTWQKFIGATSSADQAVTYAVDSLRQILFMANASETSYAARGHVHNVSALAYHFGPQNRSPDGIGAWTEIYPNSVGSAITCCATLNSQSLYTLGATDIRHLYAGAMFGLSGLTDHDGTDLSGGESGSVVRFQDAEPREGDFARTIFARDMPRAVYRTGQLTMLDGLTPHCYWVKIFHEQASQWSDDPDNNALTEAPIQMKMGLAVLVPPRPGPRRVFTRAEVRVLPAGDPSRHEHVLFLDNDVVSRRPVQRSAPWFQLEFFTEDLNVAKWHPTIRIVGWEFDLELAGQR